MFFHHLLEPRTYRAWVHYGRGSAGAARLEVSWGTWLAGFWISHDDECGWGMSIGLPPVYISVSANVPKWLQPKPDPNAKYNSWSADREISLTFHSGAILWRLWRDPHWWSKETPKWRDGNFGVVDFLLGKPSYHRKTIDERSVLVPMPEKAYPATARLLDCSWKRPRWFTKRIRRVEIEIPGGIPFPGKGENSWDCSDDATYSLTTGPCNSVAEGVGMLVGSCLRTRVRRGGWDSWVWPRPWPATPAEPDDGSAGHEPADHPDRTDAGAKRNA